MPAAAILTGADRCDRCGGMAYIRATLVSGLDLVFCQRHADEHVDALRRISAVIEV